MHRSIQKTIHFSLYVWHLVQISTSSPVHPVPLKFLFPLTQEISPFDLSSRCKLASGEKWSRTSANMIYHLNTSRHNSSRGQSLASNQSVTVHAKRGKGLSYPVIIVGETSTRWPWWKMARQPRETVEFFSGRLFNEVWRIAPAGHAAAMPRISKVANRGGGY